MYDALQQNVPYVDQAFFEILSKSVKYKENNKK